MDHLPAVTDESCAPLLDELSGAVLLLDSGGRVVLANLAARRLLAPLELPGLALEEAARRLAEAGLLRGPAGALLPPPGEAARHRLPWQAGEVLELALRPRPGGGWLAEAALAPAGAGAAEAQADALTGLATRGALEARLREAFAEAEGGGALLLLDLDRFKAVNDTLGHPVGDALLRTVARRIRNAVRAGDLAARLGGDEFAVVLAGPAGAPEAARVAERLVEVLSRAYLLEGHSVHVGASLGICLLGADARDAGEAMRHADLALYAAKDAGRGTFRFFERGMNERLQARRLLEADLRCALTMGELELAYQPLVDSASREVTGFEALLRWRHPTRGLVSPAEFIPLAEEIGLIGAMGEWVLHQACREAARWPRPVSVAVNLSPLQFRRGAVLEHVRAALAASGLDPARLDLEITESTLMDNTEEVLAVLVALRALGARISMDDFGTGYSSLSYLQRFPFDKIKIDGSFIRNLGEDAESAAIVRAIAGLGASLGLRTTAEGVETAEQVRHLTAEGCSEFQGYHFSKPLSAADATRFLLAFHEDIPA
ncbi:EAL domain-containing protein [Roseococcus sp. DSY-14]|uniref:EAL domain-containing protein n=1 Tax=Roseococcus sp. DSY-14 TaxID=3369650 RepID=UPI00387B8CA5